MDKKTSPKKDEAAFTKATYYSLELAADAPEDVLALEITVSRGCVVEEGGVPSLGKLDQKCNPRGQRAFPTHGRLENSQANGVRMVTQAPKHG